MGDFVDGWFGGLGMKRRSLLMGLGAVGVGQLMGGCGDRPGDVRVQVLRGAVPPQLIRRFKGQQEKSVSSRLVFLSGEGFQEGFESLREWGARGGLGAGKGKEKKKRNPFGLPFPIPFVESPVQLRADLMLLGDGWLEYGIRMGLVQPLAVTELSNWELVPERWQELVRRDGRGQVVSAPGGSIWAAPYRWGETVLIYRKDKFERLGWMPTDWSDLWRPELRGRISLLDQPREVIGLTLKKLGYSYNTKDLSRVSSLEAELESLHRQARFYSSDAYLQPLILGDTWLAVGWSLDGLRARVSHPLLEVVIPKAGTALWCEMWVRPGGEAGKTEDSEKGEMIKQWLDFCWSPEVAPQISLLGQAASPVILQMKPEQLPKSLQKQTLLYPGSEVLERCEFLLPLQGMEQWWNFWKIMRRSQVGE